MKQFAEIAFALFCLALIHWAFSAAVRRTRQRGRQSGIGCVAPSSSTLVDRLLKGLSADFLHLHAGLPHSTTASPEHG